MIKFSARSLLRKFMGVKAYLLIPLEKKSDPLALIFYIYRLYIQGREVVEVASEVFYEGFNIFSQ